MAAVGTAKQRREVTKEKAALSVRMTIALLRCVRYGKSIVITKPMPLSMRWSANIVIKHATTASVSLIVFNVIVICHSPQNLLGN